MAPTPGRLVYGLAHAGSDTTPAPGLPHAARTGLALAGVALALLAGCASGPPRSAGAPSGGVLATPGRDGAEANPPSDLIRVPDAEPKLEPIRSGGPNKPYEVWGQNYVPITQDTPFTERGPASWYGRKFHGQRTASGEVYNMYAMTAAHPTLPIPSYARIRNPANGREIVVRINDRGPFHSSRIVDLSYTAALKLDLLRGVAPVELTRITFDEIRTGAWRREGGDAAVAQAPAPARAAPATSTATATAPAPVFPPPAPVAVPSGMVGTVAATPADTAVPVTPPNLPQSNAASNAANRATSSPSAAPVADAPSARAFTGPARGYWVQLGPFVRVTAPRRFSTGSRPSSTGSRRCSRSSTTPRCSVCRPAPTRAARRPAASPSGCAMG